MAPGQVAATPTVHVLAESPTCDEQCSLGGETAKTPIIAGTICGFFVLLAWSIGCFIYLRKRRRRNQRLLLEGKDETEIPPEDLVLRPTKSRKRDRGEGDLIEKGANGNGRKRAAEDDVEEGPKEKVIIPPDPAVLLGHGKPGEYVLPPPKKLSSKKKDFATPPNGAATEHGLSASQSLTTSDVLGGSSTTSAPQLKNVTSNPDSPPDPEPSISHSQSVQDASIPMTHSAKRINEDVSMPGG